MLEIERRDDSATAPKVTIGQEIAPGLVARFSRQFGQEPYDEATIEYYLSRIFGCARPSPMRRRSTRAIAVPARRARRDRPAAVFQFLSQSCDEPGAHEQQVSTRCAWTMSSHGDQANTVKRPSCDATSATASR